MSDYCRKHFFTLKAAETSSLVIGVLNYCYSVRPCRCFHSKMSLAMLTSAMSPTAREYSASLLMATSLTRGLHVGEHGMGTMVSKAPCSSVQPS